MPQRRGHKRIYTILNELLWFYNPAKELWDLQRIFDPLRRKIKSPDAFKDWYARYIEEDSDLKKDSDEYLVKQAIKALQKSIDRQASHYRDFILPFIQYFLYKSISKEFEYVGIRITPCIQHDACADLVITLSPGITKKEFKDFVDEYWQKIFAQLSKTKPIFLIGRAKLRNSKNLIRDRMIYMLSRMFLDELQAIANDDITRETDLLISRILKHKYKLSVSPENIRRIISRQNKIKNWGKYRRIKK